MKNLGMDVRWQRPSDQLGNLKYTEKHLEELLEFLKERVISMEH